MYSYKFGEYEVGKARVEDVDASYKDLAEVCSNVRGKGTEQALALLNKAATGEMPILYRKYISRLAHRGELGGKPGRYPKKAVKLVLGALISAIASAKAKGLSEDLMVVHAAANKKNVYPRLSPKGGKRSRSYLETARIEVVVAERKPATKVGAKRPAQKTAPQPEKKPEIKVEAKTGAGEAKPAETKGESKPEAKPEPKDEAKAEQKTERAKERKTQRASVKKSEGKGELKGEV